MHIPSWKWTAYDSETKFLPVDKNASTTESPDTDSISPLWNRLNQSEL